MPSLYGESIFQVPSLNLAQLQVTELMPFVDTAIILCMDCARSFSAFSERSLTALDILLLRVRALYSSGELAIDTAMAKPDIFFRFSFPDCVTESGSLAVKYWAMALFIMNVSLSTGGAIYGTVTLYVDGEGVLLASFFFEHFSSSCTHEFQELLFLLTTQMMYAVPL